MLSEPMRTQQKRFNPYVPTLTRLPAPEEKRPLAGDTGAAWRPLHALARRVKA